MFCDEESSTLPGCSQLDRTRMPKRRIAMIVRPLNNNVFLFFSITTSLWTMENTTIDAEIIRPLSIRVLYHMEIIP